SGGSIWVYSELGQGSTFRLLFPIVKDTAVDVEPAAEVKSLSGDETILLAEDEDGVRKYVINLLSQRGYQVLPASDGKSAMELAVQHRGRIDLLLTDLVMPGMSGLDLASQFAKVRPGVPVLYMSGYSDRLWRHKGTELNLVQKPFTSKA